jgi:putative DNA primase/helicase
MSGVWVARRDAVARVGTARRGDPLSGMQRTSVARQGERTDVMAEAPIAASIPRVMRDTDRWVVWRYEPSPSNPDVLTKVPYSAHDGRNASSTDPATWATFKKALLFHADNDWTDGVGMVMCDADDFVGIDLDHCRNAETGEIEPWAQKVVDTVDSYTEITPSNEGLRIFARGTLPPSGRKRGDFEIYESGRYLTVTGRHLDGTPMTVEPRELEIRRVHREVWPDQGKPTPERPRPLPVDASDEDLLRMAQEAANGGKFSDLWSGGKAGHPSQSEADMALCMMLAFWTGCDAGRMDSLFRRSGLMRPKWDVRHFGGGETYGAHTIDQAIANTAEVYKPPLVGRSLGRIHLSDVEHEPGSAVATDDGTVTLGPSVRPLTESGNAERLVDQFGRDIRFCHPWSAWLHWDGRRWKRDQTGAVRHLAKNVIRSIRLEAAVTDDKDQRKAIWDWAKKSESSNARLSMLRLAESEPGIPIMTEDMDRDPYLFNVENGTINLHDCRLWPHERMETITKLATVAFDAEAECPTFLRFLDRILPDLEVRRFVRRMAGYCLTGDTSEQCLFFLYGGGSNGKSTLLTVLRRLMGEYAQQAAPNLLVERKNEQHPTEIARLFGARMVTSIEVDDGKRLAEGLVKQMTGGDPMVGRLMRENFFEWMPTHKLIVAANHQPEIRGTDYAIWRRIHLVPFAVEIPMAERDPELPDKLALELPGILNWALAGCREWQQGGLGVPAAVQAATADYRDQQDTIGAFLEDRCIEDPQASVASNVLYSVYSAWCEASGTSRLGPNRFGRELTNRGFERGKGTGGTRIWRGLYVGSGGGMAH